MYTPFVRTVEYEPSPRVSPNTKSCADRRVFADGFCDRERMRDFERGFDCLWAKTDSGATSRCAGSSDTPSSLVRYAGGDRTDGAVGGCGLQERGEENVRVGRGRGVLRTVLVLVSESEDKDMADVFLLRSASVGVGAGWGKLDDSRTPSMARW